MIKNFFSKTLPFVAAAALLYPGARKVLDGSWRDELGTTYQLGDRDFGGTFFLLVGLLELIMAAAIVWPRTRVPAGFVMAGFFVGALISNLGFRVDQALLPSDRPGLSTLIPLDLSHLFLGLAIALLWQAHNRETAQRSMIAG